MPSILQPSDNEFELAFADLAHAQLRDRAPALLDYLQGFQIVESNEDQTHGIAVMAFKIGEQRLLVPVFFLNGEIKMNLLYLVEQDMFVPLQDNWVTYIINRRPMSIGRPENRKENELGVMPPSLANLVVGDSAYGTAGPYGSFNYRYACDRMLKTREAPISLPDFLRKTAGAGTATTLLRSMRRNHKLANALLRFYELSDFDVRPTRVKSADRRFVPPPRRLLDDAPRVGPGAGVRILSRKDAAAPLLSDGDRGRLLRGELIVKDAREQVNEIYSADGSVRLQNPSQSGHYRLLLDDSTFADVFIAIPPRAIGYDVVRVALVINKANGECGYWWAQNLWCLPEKDSVNEQSHRDWWEKLPAAEDVESGKTYSFIDTHGDATIALNISSKNRLGSGRVELGVNPALIRVTAGMYDMPEGNYRSFGRGSEGDGGRLPTSRVCGHEYPQGDGGVRFQMVNHVVLSDDDRGIRVVSSTMFVPRSAKAIQLDEGLTPLTTSWSTADPGSLADLKMGLLGRGMQSFTLKKAGNDVYVDGRGPFSKQQVLVALVQRVGIREKDARDALALAEKRAACFMVKNAIGYAPPIPDAPYSVDPDLGALTTEPYSEALPMPSVPDSNLSEYMSDGEADLMSRAAETGQKEVIDSAAIGSLVRTVDNDDLITRYLSDIMLGMDRVNRILFTYYWNNDKFRDRYGHENLVELEDQLKNVSRSLGDLVLALKQRRVEGAPVTDAMDLQLGPVGAAS